MVALVVLILFFIRYEDAKHEESVKRYLDFNTELLLKSIEEQKLTALTISLLLSQNSDIKSCILGTGCEKTLKNYIEILEKLYPDILIHIHSKDLKSVMRSWDHTLKGDNLSYFRHTIYESMQTKEPVSGIEAGRCGVFIRGVSPTFLDANFSGSVEVMLGFKPLFELSKRQNYDLFILINDSFKIECFMDKHLKIKNFILLNKDESNLNLLQILENLELKNDKFIKQNSHYFYIKELKDFKDSQVGYIVLHISGDENERNLKRINPKFN